MQEESQVVVITPEEKRQMCDELADHLPKIRSLLNVTQAELGYLCGFSRIRVSQIETKVAKMTWSQLTSIVLLCFENMRTKEYFYANDLLGVRFLQFMQRKDENIPPNANVNVREELIQYKDKFKKD